MSGIISKSLDFWVKLRYDKNIKPGKSVTSRPVLINQLIRRRLNFMTAIINSIRSLENQVTSKICSICGMIKPAHVDYFYNRKNTHDGFRMDCKSCMKKTKLKHYLENRESIIRKIEMYTEENREKVRTYQSNHYRKNRKERIAKAIEYQQNNRVRRGELVSIRYRTSPFFKLNMLISGGIRESLKRGSKSQRHWEGLVDFTIEQLEQRLKRSIPKGYSWSDFITTGKLHIDHILPISKFNFEKPEDDDFKRCWALSNLRLLPALENIAKGNKLEKPLQMGLIFG